MWVKKQQLELDMEQLTGSKLGKGNDKAVYYHPVYLTYVRVHHAKCQTGWFTSWNQDCWEKNQQPQTCKWYHSSDKKWKRTKEPLDEDERGGEKIV